MGIGDWVLGIGNWVLASATKNSYKIGQKRVTLSPDKKKEEVIWERSDLIKSRSWLY